jgi:hypothetical protein
MESNFKKTKDHYISDKNEEKWKNYRKNKKLYANDEGNSSDEEDNNTNMSYSWPSMNSLMMKPRNLKTLKRKDRLILKVN